MYLLRAVKLKGHKCKQYIVKFSLIFGMIIPDKHSTPATLDPSVKMKAIISFNSSFFNR